MGNKFLHMVIPWDKEIENILERLTRDRVAYTKNTRLSSEFGSKYPDIIDAGFLDVVTTNYRRSPQKTIFVLAPNAVVLPQKKKFSFHKIF